MIIKIISHLYLIFIRISFGYDFMDFFVINKLFCIALTLDPMFSKVLNGYECIH